MKQRVVHVRAGKPQDGYDAGGIGGSLRRVRSAAAGELCSSVVEPQGGGEGLDVVADHVGVQATDPASVEAFPLKAIQIESFSLLFINLFGHPSTRVRHAPQSPSSPDLSL